MPQGIPKNGINKGWIKKGQKLSKKTIEKIRTLAKKREFGKWMKGKKHTEETKRKMSEWHKGKLKTLETKRNMSEGQKGRKHSLKTRGKMSEAHKGIKLSLERRKKMSETHKARKEQNHLWKGGITPINAKIRTSLEYRLWREAVFKRDDWTCVWCGIKSGNGKAIILNADHIKPFALFPELRFALDNGRTLCIDCHKTTKTYGRPLKTNKQTIS